MYISWEVLWRAMVIIMKNRKYYIISVLMILGIGLIYYLGFTKESQEVFDGTLVKSNFNSTINYIKGIPIKELWL